MSYLQIGLLLELHNWLNLTKIIKYPKYTIQTICLKVIDFGKNDNIKNALILLFLTVFHKFHFFDGKT